MKRAPAAILLSIAMALNASATAAHAQSSAYADPIASFDLVAPGVGWAASSTHLYWTASNGHHWRDITPPRASKDEPIQLACFTDPLHGWALLVADVENQPPTLEVERTTNGGSSWTLVSVDLSRIPIDPATIPSIDSLSFSDRSHGWILVNTSSPGVRSSALIVTVDAGAHWRVLRTLPMNGNISFSSPANGILTVSAPNGDAPIWHTRNGGKSWTPSNLPAPADCPKCVPSHVDSARFTTANHALLTATVKTPGKDDPSSIGYFTSDGGASWTVAQPSSQPTLDTDRRLTTVTNSRIVTIGAAPRNRLLLNINGRLATIQLPPRLSPGALDRLTVAQDRSAWALFSSPQSALVSIDSARNRTRVITPRPSNIESRSQTRHRRDPKPLLIHCTLVSARPSFNLQTPPNDIIRPNEASKENRVQ